MKNSKVIIACIDTKYVEDEHCKMEFQFAKSTLRKPVVPLIVGEDMSWNMSVVGKGFIRVFLSVAGPQIRFNRVIGPYWYYYPESFNSRR